MMMTKDEKRDKGLRAEEKYKALVETAPDAIFTLDLLGRFTFVNPAAERISGYSKEELVGRHFRDLLPAKDIPACLNVFQKAMRGQPTPPIEIEMITKKGGRVALELQGSPVKRGRRIVEIIAIARDITERKRAEKALQESEQRYRAIFEQAADSLWLVDAETGALVVFNDRAHENLGYTREEFERLKIPDFEVIECAEEVAKHIEKIVKEGADTFETKHRTKGGEIRDILVSSRAITVGGKDFVQSMCRDITERKQAEEEIRTLSQFLDSVVDNANVWLNVLDEKAKVVIWNRAAEEISGYSREEVVGHDKIWEWLYPDEEYRDEVFAQAVAIIEKGGEERDAETTIWCKDGRTRIISWNSRRLVDERGNPIGSIALGRDITERKQAEEALRIGQSAIASSINAIAFADLKGNLTYVNDAFLKLWGHDDEKEVLGKPAVEFWQMEEKALEVVEALRDRGGWTGELVAMREDGSLFDVQLSASMVADEVGEPVCMMASFVDITERKRAEEEIHRRSEELAALYDVSLDVAGQLDLDTLLKTILLRATELLRASAGGGLYLYDPERQDLELVVHQAFKKDLTGIRLAMGEGACGKVAQSGDPLVVTDYAKWEGRSPHFDDEPTFSVLAVPIKRGDTLLGALYVDGPDVERRFDDEDIRLATLFANQAAIAIENARLYEDTKSQLAQLSALQDTTRAVASTLELDKLLHLITQQATTLLQGDGGILNLVDWEKKEDEVVAGSGSAAATLGYRSPLEGSLSGWATLHNQPVISNQLQNDSRADRRPRSWLVEGMKEQTQSVAIAPLAIRDQVMGTLVVMDKQGGKGEFDQADLDLLVAFANQAATAIENARLYEETQKRLSETTVLHKVSEIINATLDLQEVFQHVVEELSNAFGYRLVDICLVEEEGLRLQAQVGYDAETAIDFTPLERGVIGRVARTGQPAFIPDVSQDPDYIPTYPEIKSEICVPVKSGETLLGTLNVESDAKRLLTDDDLKLLVTLSSHIGVAIKNARLYEETQRLAITDGLTGLYNLRYFYEGLEKEIRRSERYHHSLSLIILDIDDFKVYNDLYGHLAGDALLKGLAQLMSQVTRGTDTLARYGGEEFAIILPETETEGVRFLAERLLEKVREHRFSIQDGQTTGRITISVGVATYPHHADGAKVLVDAADNALLQAKREGKDRVCVHGLSAAQI